jgi:uncharacterized membrane protein
MTDELRTEHPSTAAIGGHPIHPAVVPVPIGLLVAASVSDLAHVATGDRFFARASRLLVAGGVASGVGAALPGLLDLLTIRAARNRVGYAHAGGNAAILALGAASLAMRAGQTDRVPSAAMGLSLVGSALLALTGWLGGELAFRHRIGVVPLAER